jgi:hypothetical protein
VASMLQLDSRTCDGLQIADLFTSAMMHEVRQAHGLASRANPKGLLVDDIRSVLNVESLAPVRTPRFKTMMYRHPKAGPHQGVLIE